MDLRAVVPAFLDLKLLCDPRPAVEQVLAYRFYERSGTNWILLGAASTNALVLSNVLVTVPHTYGVSASNALGESDLSQPYLAPTDPHPPLRLRLSSTNAIVLQTSLDGGLTWSTAAIIASNPAAILLQRAALFRSARTNLPPPLP